MQYFKLIYPGHARWRSTLFPLLCQSGTSQSGSSRRARHVTTARSYQGITTQLQVFCLLLHIAGKVGCTSWFAQLKEMHFPLFFQLNFPYFHRPDAYRTWLNINHILPICCKKLVLSSQYGRKHLLHYCDVTFLRVKFLNVNLRISQDFCILFMKVSSLPCCRFFKSKFQSLDF